MCCGISKRDSMFCRPVHIVIILMLLLLVSASGDTDWEQQCSSCHCNWHNGMRTADCKNKSFTTIPANLNSEIQVLELSNNLIPEIRREEFHDVNLQNLHKLYMRNCTLQELNRDALKGLAVLIELDLSNNLLRALHPGTFAGLERLRKVMVNNNEIEALENNLFENLVQLHKIEFKNNHIKKIEVKTFVNLPVLSIIYLDSNQLTMLRKETFVDLPKLIELSLSQNPWNCTCELQAFRNFTISRNFSKLDTYCHEPAHLRNKPWTEITSEHFACRPRVISPRDGFTMLATNENATLTCRIRGSPKPNVFWFYNRRPINLNDQRVQIRNSIDTSRFSDVLVSDLTIYGIRSNDKGTYVCIAENRGGKDEVEIQLSVNVDRFLQGDVEDSSSSILLVICIVVVSLLLLLSIVLMVLCWYCRRIKRHSKDSTMSESGLISSKIDKSQNGSVLEGSVIIEMQKSLLTEVNPVEKPPRRTDIEAVDTDDGHEIKKTLLDETPFGSHDEETNSVALSDTTPRSRQTFVDDGYGTNLPPDLLSFPARVPQSPSLQSSMSNIPDNRFYGKSPLSSPVYQHVNPNNGGVYGTTPAAFRTLQHPKNRNLQLANSRNQSPFIPAPVVYPQVVMKQGYMTIPRKPRVPSWTPSASSAMSEFQPSNPSTGTASTDVVEPVYDNLGLRTTASGNSLLNINKIGSNPPVRYTMKDRPLPATPNTSATIGPSSSNSAKIYEPIHELGNPTMTSDTEPLYGTAKSNNGVTIVPSATLRQPEKISKIPPRPPPKPKKKISVTSTGQGSTSQLFEDEGEDGTEV